MRFLRAVFDGVERYMIIICLSLIVLLVFSGVLSRFVFHYSIAWSEELVRYLFIWGGLFGAAAGFRYNKHSGIPIVIEYLPQWAQRLSAWLVMLASVGYCGFMGLQGVRSAMRAFATGQMSSSTNIPVWVVNFVMAMAFAWCSIRAAQAFFATAGGPSELEEELQAAAAQQAEADDADAGKRG